MVLYIIKNLLPVKHILKTLPSNDFNKYIKMLKENILQNSQWRNFIKKEKDEIVLKKLPQMLLL